jgi:hypothetical protein
MVRSVYLCFGGMVAHSYSTILFPPVGSVVRTLLDRELAGDHGDSSPRTSLRDGQGAAGARFALTSSRAI